MGGKQGFLEMEGEKGNMRKSKEIIFYFFFRKWWKYILVDI